MSKEKTIGECLKDYRMKAGLTMIQISEEIRVKTYNYRHYETGTLPPIPILKKLALFHNVLVDDLIGGNGWLNPNKDLPNISKNSKTKLRVWIYGGSKMTFNCEGAYLNGKFYMDGSDVTQYVELWRNIPQNPEA